MTPLLVPFVAAPALAWLVTLSVAVVTFVAGLFGIKLRTRGVARFREFLLNPRFLLCVSAASTLVTIAIVFRRGGSGQLAPEDTVMEIDEFEVLAGDSSPRVDRPQPISPATDARATDPVSGSTSVVDPDPNAVPDTNAVTVPSTPTTSPDTVAAPVAPDPSDPVRVPSTEPTSDPSSAVPAPSAADKSMSATSVLETPIAASAPAAIVHLTALSRASDPIGDQSGEEDSSGYVRAPTLLWSEGSGSFFRAPTVRRYVWTANRSGTIYAFDTCTGNTVVRFSRSSLGLASNSRPVFSGVLVHRNLVYVGEGAHKSRNCAMNCYEFRKGVCALKWRHLTTGHTEGIPLRWENRLFFAAGGQGLLCCNADTGAKLWEIHESRIGHCDNGLLLIDGVLFCNTGVTNGYARNYPDSSAHVLAVNAGTGEIEWQIPVNASWFGVGWSRRRDLLLFPLGQIAKYRDLDREHAQYHNGVLITTRDGTVKNCIRTELPVVEPPVCHGDWVYVYELDTTFHSRSGESTSHPNRTRVVRYPLPRITENIDPEMVFTDPAMGSAPPSFYGTLMVQPLLDGTLLGLDLRSCRELWRVPFAANRLTRPASRPIIRPRHIYLNCSYDGVRSSTVSVFCFGRSQ